MFDQTNFSQVFSLSRSVSQNKQKFTEAGRCLENVLSGGRHHLTVSSDRLIKYRYYLCVRMWLMWVFKKKNHYTAERLVFCYVTNNINQRALFNLYAHIVFQKIKCTENEKSDGTYSDIMICLYKYKPGPRWPILLKREIFINTFFKIFFGGGMGWGGRISWYGPCLTAHWRKLFSPTELGSYLY